MYKKSHSYLIWPDPDISSGQIKQWMPPSNSAPQMTKKKHVSQDTHLVTLYDLTLNLAFAQYKAHTYILLPWSIGITFGKYVSASPQLFLVAVSVADNEKSDGFDPLLDLWSC